MAKEKGRRKFPWRRLILLLVGVLLLLLGGFATIFRIKSHQELEEFVQKLEGFSQQETTLLLAADKLDKELKDEFDAIVLERTADPAKNRKHLAKAKEIYTEEYEKQKDEYFPLVEEKTTEISQFLNRRRSLWLWRDEVEFLNLISSVAEAAIKAKEADAVILERGELLSAVSFAVEADSVEYFSFLKNYDRLITSSTSLMKALAPFKKYTTGYKFSGEGQLKTLYPTVYKALTNYKTLYAKVYEMYVAYTSGNYVKAYQLSAEVVSISKRSFDLTVDWEPLYRPFFQEELDAHVNGLLAVNFYNEKKLGKVLLGARRLAAWSLVWAARLYALDHEDKYPEVGSITNVVKMLVEGNYLPSTFHFDQTTFSCSISKEKYRLSFTDEITGEAISLTSVDLK